MPRIARAPILQCDLCEQTSGTAEYILAAIGTPLRVRTILCAVHAAPIVAAMRAGQPLAKAVAAKRGLEPDRLELLVRS